jgi:ABC-type nitrate/sulfonate/bicarbonate transport system substrate-binding protein
MFRTYYALAIGAVKMDGINMKVIEMPDPPSREQEEALINGDVQAGNLYLPNFLQRKLQGAPIVGLCTEWKSTMKGNGMFVRKDSGIQSPADLVGRQLASHQDRTPSPLSAAHKYGVDDTKLNWASYRQELLLPALKEGKVDAAVLLDQFFFRGEEDLDIRCPIPTEKMGSAARLPEMIKHMVAMREDRCAIILVLKMSYSKDSARRLPERAASAWRF